MKKTIIILSLVLLVNTTYTNAQTIKFNDKEIKVDYKKLSAEGKKLFDIMTKFFSTALQGVRNSITINDFNALSNNTLPLKEAKRIFDLTSKLLDTQIKALQIKDADKLKFLEDDSKKIQKELDVLKKDIEQKYDEALVDKLSQKISDEFAKLGVEKLIDEMEGIDVFIQNPEGYKKNIYEKIEQQNKHTNQKSLVDIVNNNKLNIAKRKEALIKLSDKEAIVNIFDNLTAKDKELRKICIEKVTDQDELARFYDNATDKDVEIKKLLIAKVTNEDELARFYDNATDKDVEIKKLLIAKVTDQDELGRFYDNATDKDVEIKKLLIAKVTNQDDLARFYDNATDNDVEIKKLLIAKVTNQDDLARFYNNATEKDVEIKKLLITKITDNNVLDDLLAAEHNITLKRIITNKRGLAKKAAPVKIITDTAVLAYNLLPASNVISLDKNKLIKQNIDFTYHSVPKITEPQPLPQQYINNNNSIVGLWQLVNAGNKFNEKYIVYPKLYFKVINADGTFYTYNIINGKIKMGVYGNYKVQQQGIIYEYVVKNLAVANMDNSPSLLLYNSINSDYMEVAYKNFSPNRTIAGQEVWQRVGYQGEAIPQMKF